MDEETQNCFSNYRTIERGENAVCASKNVSITKIKINVENNIISLYELKANGYIYKRNISGVTLSEDNRLHKPSSETCPAFLPKCLIKLLGVRWRRRDIIYIMLVHARSICDTIKIKFWCNWKRGIPIYIWITACNRFSSSVISR